MRKVFYILVCVMLSAALSVNISGCGNGGSSEKPGTSYGNVTGTVTNSVTGQPIEGVYVWIGLSGTKSAPDGTYILENVESGKRTIQAKLEGYDNYESEITVPVNDTLTKNISMNPAD